MKKTDIEDMERRDLLRATGAGLGTAAMVSFSGCAGDEDGEPADDGEPTDDGEPDDEGFETIEAPYVLTEDALDMIPFQLGQEEGIFADYGINLNIEITGYGEYSRALTTGDSDFGNADQSMFVDAHTADFEQVAFGSNLLQLNSIFVREDSDIESPADLEGRRVGVPFWESGTTLGMRATIQDEYGFSLREDTDGTAADPPVLQELLLDGEIDAAAQFTGFTIRGFANDELRSIYDIGPYWEDRTGHPLEVIYFAAREEWLEDNWDVAYRFSQAWEESLELLAEDPGDAYSRLGLLAGLQTDEEVEIAVDRFNDGQVHHLEQSAWNEEYIDAQHEFLELLEQYDLKDEAPPREKMITHDELAENAGE